MKLDVLPIAIALGLIGSLAGCPADDDDLAGDDDTSDDDVGDDDTGDDDTGDDDAADDDSAGDDDSYDCLGSPLPTEVGADGSGLVQGAVDGSEIWFVIDTAAQVIFADLEVSGGSTGYFYADVEIGWFHQPKWSCKGRDLTENQAFIGRDVGALLGQDVFMQSWVLFDPQAAFSYVCPADPGADPPGLIGPPMVQPYTLENQFAVTEVDLGLGSPVPLMLDTGLPVTYLTEEVFDQVDTGAPRLHGWVFRTNYGEDPAFVSRVPSLTFGGDPIADQDVVVIPTEHHLAGILAASHVDVAGFLGNSVLDRYAYAVDGDTENLQLWPVEAPWLDPDRWTRVGVEPTWRDGQIAVEFVFQGSDAEAQGVAVGDVVTAIDGVDAATLTLTEVHQALRGIAGSTRHLDLEGTGGPYAVDVAVEALLP